MMSKRTGRLSDEICLDGRIDCCAELQRIRVGNERGSLSFEMVSMNTGAIVSEGSTATSASQASIMQQDYHRKLPGFPRCDYLEKLVRRRRVYLKRFP